MNPICTIFFPISQETAHLKNIRTFLQSRYYRGRKIDGTGLGLSIDKHIAQVHGGQLTVERKLGQGSTFIIHLPRLLT